MHPVRKQRLFMVLFIVVASTVGVGLVLFALQDNMNLFYPPSKIVSGEAPVAKTIRAGGCVVPGSIKRDDSSLKVMFDVTDGMAELTVSYEGILPDLFAEGEAAVLTGQLQDSGVFEASKVLAKHDETYMPSEVSDTLQTDNGESANDAEDYAKHAASCEGLAYDS